MGITARCGSRTARRGAENEVGTGPTWKYSASKGEGVIGGKHTQEVVERKTIDWGERGTTVNMYSVERGSRGAKERQSLHIPDDGDPWL
jgi:hypothetical protein